MRIREAIVEDLKEVQGDDMLSCLAGRKTDIYLGHKK
jgi:hypothetical protein